MYDDNGLTALSVRVCVLRGGLILYLQLKVNCVSKTRVALSFVGDAGRGPPRRSGHLDQGARATSQGKSSGAADPGE